MRLSPVDVNFISQLSFAGGVAVDARAPPSYYLAGVNPELHILCPELAALRDIVFLLKAMMAGVCYSQCVPSTPFSRMEAACASSVIWPRKVTTSSTVQLSG